MCSILVISQLSKRHLFENRIHRSWNNVQNYIIFTILHQCRICLFGNYFFFNFLNVSQKHYHTNAPSNFVNVLPKNYHSDACSNYISTDTRCYHKGDKYRRVSISGRPAENLRCAHLVLLQNYYHKEQNSNSREIILHGWVFTQWCTCEIPSYTVWGWKQTGSREYIVWFIGWKGSSLHIRVFTSSLRLAYSTHNDFLTIYARGLLNNIQNGDFLNQPDGDLVKNSNAHEQFRCGLKKVLEHPWPAIAASVCVW